MRPDRPQFEAGDPRPIAALERSPFLSLADGPPNDDPVRRTLLDVDDVHRAMLGGTGAARLPRRRPEMRIAMGLTACTLHGQADGLCGNARRAAAQSEEGCHEQ